MTAALEGGEWPTADPVRILQEVGWAPGPVWTGGKSRPHPETLAYIYLIFCIN